LELQQLYSKSPYYIVLLLRRTKFHDSLHQKIFALPETLEIYPAHFSGSLCGAGMSGKPMSTLAFEKRWNPTLTLDRAAFIEKMRSTDRFSSTDIVQLNSNIYFGSFQDN